MTSYYLLTNGIRLHYLHAVADKPVILLLHGLTANAHAFDGLLAAGLHPAFNVFTVDLRGRGLSDAPEYGYTMKEHAADIIGLMDQLGMEKIVVAGHSFGGFLGLYLARFYPDRISKLILMDAAARMHPDTKEMLQPAMSRLGKRFDSFQVYIDTVKKAPYLTQWDDHMLSYYRADVRDHPDGSVSVIPGVQQMTEAILRGSLGEPWEEYLEAISHTAILINAPGIYTSGAALLPEDNAMETVELMKNCIYAKVPGNHQTMLYGAGAKETVSIIKHFLN
jgi:pimeloyl-ACP methyl ester carboxylesterase